MNFFFTYFENCNPHELFSDGTTLGTIMATIMIIRKPGIMMQSLGIKPGRAILVAGEHSHYGANPVALNVII